jgi:hypothetical protein
MHPLLAHFSDVASSTMAVCNVLKTGHQPTRTAATKASVRHCSAHSSSGEA